MPVSLTPVTPDPVWTSREELNSMFGETNVDQWGDLENTGNASLIANTINEACEDATDDARSRLRNSAAGTIVVAPRILRRNVTRLAGMLLYESRGVSDAPDSGEGKHRLAYSNKRADAFFRAVQAGQIQLTGAVPPTSYPFAVPHLTKRDGTWRTPEQAQLANEASERSNLGTDPLWGDGFFSESSEPE